MSWDESPKLFCDWFHVQLRTVLGFIGFLPPSFHPLFIYFILFFCVIFRDREMRLPLRWRLPEPPGEGLYTEYVPTT